MFFCSWHVVMILSGSCCRDRRDTVQAAKVALETKSERALVVAAERVSSAKDTTSDLKETVSSTHVHLRGSTKWSTLA